MSNSRSQRGTPPAPRNSERPLRWVSWSAVSSLPQAKEVSLAEQRAAAREHAARHGGVLIEELEVPGKSRSIVLFEDACSRIPAYARLRDLLDARAFDVLIFLDSSRLGRTAALVMTVTALCEAAGVTCYEMDAPPATLSARTSYADDLVGAIRAVGAQQEVRKLRDRHKMGMTGRVKKGLLPGRIPYGYRKAFDPDTGQSRYEPDPTAAAVVALIYREYLAGRGQEAITDWLNQSGYVAPHGGAWQWSTVRAIINRPWTYAGYVEYSPARGEPPIREPGLHPAIISEEDALRTEREKAYRQPHRQVTRAHLLSGVCVCDVCGTTMNVHTWASPRYPEGRYKGLECPNRSPDRPKHTRNLISIRFIMPALRAALESHAAMSPEDAVRAAQDVKDDEADVLAAAVAGIEDELTVLKGQLHYADSLLVSGSLDPERHAVQAQRLVEAIAAAKQRLARAREQLARVEHRGNRRKRLMEVHEVGATVLDSDDIQRANAWMREHVRIHILNGKVTEIVFI